MPEEPAAKAQTPSEGGRAGGQAGGLYRNCVVFICRPRVAEMGAGGGLLCGPVWEGTTQPGVGPQVNNS
jgi:hypothetical protein